VYQEERGRAAAEVRSLFFLFEKKAIEKQEEEENSFFLPLRVDSNCVECKAAQKLRLNHQNR
jgi:hypothetical protein